MRKTLWILFIFVLCLPMIFVGWLVLATRSARMDSTTMNLSPGLRSMVADGVLQAAGYGKKSLPSLYRVVMLEPDNSAAWDRLCAVESNAAPQHAIQQTCKTAVAMDDSADNWGSLGRAQEQRGDPCAADESFTKAASRAANEGAADYAESMGRAALRCGQYYDARAGLEAAIDLEAKEISDTKNWDDDEIAEFKQDQLDDREYLILTLDHLHEAKAMKAACSLAHPGWAACACKLDDKGTVRCAESR